MLRPNFFFFSSRTLRILIPKEPDYLRNNLFSKKKSQYAEGALMSTCFPTVQCKINLKIIPNLSKSLNPASAPMFNSKKTNLYLIENCQIKHIRA